MANHRWRVIVLLMLFAALGHFNRVGITVAGDEVFIPKFGIEETRMGWVYTAFLIVYTIGMLPGGWLIDRIGAVRTLTLYGVSMGVFVMLTGTLGWITENPYYLWIGLLIIRGMAGVCNSPLHPGAAHVVSGVMQPQRRATANGFITAGALVGIACCYPGFGWLMDSFSWPLAFVISGFLLACFGVFWFFTASPIVHETPNSDDGEDSESTDKSRMDLLTDPNLWLITLSYAAYGYFQYLFFYWMGYYFKEVLNVPAEDARWASFWIMLAQGAGMAIGGSSTDLICRFFGVVWGRRTIVFFGMGFGAIFGFIAIGYDNLISISVYFALAMAATGMVEGVFWTTATDIGGKSRGLSGAFMNTGGNAGGLISPVLTPVIAASVGWSGSIIVACIIAAAGGLLWLGIRPPVEDAQAEQ